MPALLCHGKRWGAPLCPDSVTPTLPAVPSPPAGPGRTLRAAPLLGSALGSPVPRRAAVGGCPQGEPQCRAVGLGSRLEMAHSRVMWAQHGALSPKSATRVPTPPPCRARPRCPPPAAPNAPNAPHFASAAPLPEPTAHGGIWGDGAPGGPTAAPLWGTAGHGVRVCRDTQTAQSHPAAPSRHFWGAPGPAAAEPTESQWGTRGERGVWGSGEAGGPRQ